jgi:hypothetical protein
VVDHQVVAMELESGASVALVMQGHSYDESRTMRYDGTRATLRGVFGRQQSIVVIDHASGEAHEVEIPDPGKGRGGHGGGDGGIIESFLATVESGAPPTTSASESYESHLLAFLAEEARLAGTVIDVSSRR